MYFEDYSIGQTFSPPPVTLTQEEIMTFARQYDALPLHLDPEYAQRSRFGGIIASGFHTLCAFWGQWAKLGIGGAEVLAGIGIDALNWKAPVYPGDTLSGELEVIDLIPSSKEGQGVLAVKATVCNQSGDVVLVLQCKSLVKRRIEA